MIMWCDLDTARSTDGCGMQYSENQRQSKCCSEVTRVHEIIWGPQFWRRCKGGPFSRNRLN
jgi:hypothetical protein